MERLGEFGFRLVIWRAGTEHYLSLIHARHRDGPGFQALKNGIRSLEPWLSSLAGGVTYFSRFAPDWY